MATILVLESYPAIMLLMEHILSQEGYNVLVLEHASSTIYDAASIQIDLIVFGDTPEFLDGEPVLFSWIRQHPKYRSIPILFASAAHELLSSRLQVLDLDKVSLLPEPFSKSELLCAVDRALNG